MIFDLKVVKYLDESKSLKTQSFICLCWLTSRQSNWLILAADINQGCKNMCANPQSNWLNTIAVRASYILPILKRFPWWKPRKTEGEVVYLPLEKNQNRNQSVFLSFGVDPLTGKVSLKSVGWHVARLSGVLVDTLLEGTSETSSIIKAEPLWVWNIKLVVLLINYWGHSWRRNEKANNHDTDFEPNPLP